MARVAAAAARLATRYTFEFILVDDGRRTEHSELAKGLIAGEPRLRVVELRRNFGQTAALQAGLTAARGDLVVSLDSDLQHFPEDLPLFLNRDRRGIRMVCGWRHARQEGVLRRWPSRAANLLIRFISGLRVHESAPPTAPTAAICARAAARRRAHRFVPVLAALVGARVTEVKIQNIERPAGRSNYGLGRTVNVFLDIMYLYFARFYFGAAAEGVRQDRTAVDCIRRGDLRIARGLSDRYRHTDDSGAGAAGSCSRRS